MHQEWTTEAQKKFLEEELVAFKRIGGRQYMKHWDELFKKWLLQWPERNAALFDISMSAMLTTEQTDTLSNALKNRQDQLQRWMHWHAGAGDKHSANSKTIKIMNTLLKVVYILVR